MTSDQLPPHDDLAEAGALGCIMLANGEAPELFDQLTLDDFYIEVNRTVFRAMELQRLDRKPLDTVAVFSRLRKMGETAAADYAPILPDKSPSAANFPAYLETLREMAIRRAVQRDAGELKRLAESPGVSTKVLADAAHRALGHYATLSNNRLPPLHDAAQFLAEPLERPQEIIAGILHKGSKLVVGGGSKSYKTWTLLDLALCVAHGIPWLQFTTSAGRVLYVNFEIQSWSWHTRLEAVAKARDISVTPGQLTLWNLRGQAAKYNLLFPQIRDAAKQDFALIVLDPIYKLYGQTDENSASDVAQLLNAIEDLTVTTGAAVVFGAHFSKGNQANKESLDRISGSGVFARDPDSILVFTKHKQDGAFTVEATLRNFPPISPFVVRWHYPLMVCDTGLDPKKLKKRGGRPKEHTADQLLAVLGDQSLTTGEWQKQALEKEGIRDRTFSDLKKELQKLGRVLKSKINRKWQRVSA